MNHSPHWPDIGLDSDDMRAIGWKPVPLREFVLKVHQRCNLACSYCYVYEMADQSWRDRPMLMDWTVVEATAYRIAEHARAHALHEVTVVLHGGEPLLAGVDRLATIARMMRQALPDGIVARIGLQTNGVLLTNDRLQVLLDNNIRVAVSVDGDATAHDKHRRFVDGRPSFGVVETALRRLNTKPFRPIFAGLLCTANPSMDPVIGLRTLAGFNAPAIDILLPHANHETGVQKNIFGPWLARMFDEYFDQPKRFSIRLFDEIINLALGGQSRSEHVGLSPAAVVVVESDGSIEQTDALKSAYPGAAATGLSVSRDSFDAALEHPGLIARQIGLRALSPTCQACTIRTVCGGGHYAHRYRQAGGYLNPTVYCEDMALLIAHIGRRISEQLLQTRREPQRNDN